MEFLLQISKSEVTNNLCTFRARFYARLEIQTPNKSQTPKMKVIKLLEIVFMLELEYETPNFKLAAYLTPKAKQTQDDTCRPKARHSLSSNLTLKIFLTLTDPI